uniref:Small ribosomal subunit protein bS1 n=1 Tax=uncultured Acidobacteriota bacterium TaxID=171953 RepID=H5SPS3_9BACT|nr:30S ribosomal protein S1 [uncultured Acidobacteriota bacterium]
MGINARNDDERGTNAMDVNNMEQPVTEAQSLGVSPAPTEPEAIPTSESFGDLLGSLDEQTTTTLAVGQMLTGKVLAIGEDLTVIDIGYKTEGVIPTEELQISLKEITIGDEIPVIVKHLESPDGYVKLSYAEAQRKLVWAAIDRAFKTGAPITGRITERIKGGLKVNLGGVEAFLPASQVDLRQVRNLEAWKGREIEARVIKVNRRQQNIVLSRRALLEEEEARRRAQILSQLEEGYIVEGRVKSLADYGAFVDIGGIDGLLHITDISWKKIAHPKEVFTVGEVIQVKILKIDRETGRINLGYKQLWPNPWDTLAERLPPGSRVKGKVTRVTDYGAFVEVEEGIEGLIHASELTWEKRPKHPSKYVSPGDEVLVEVLQVDAQNRRLSLSLRQLQPDPWRLFAETHSIGARVRGRVRGITDFGAFVEVEKGIEGLVHVSDISRRRVKHPSEVLKKGQEVEAIIKELDLAARRLGLSMKELEPDPWEEFFNTHRVGDIVRGKVVRFASFGAFVDVGGVEGLCHISELSDEHVEKPEDVVQIGEELDFRILRLNPEERRIALSARAARHDREPAYTIGEDTGRIASLGEIARQREE